MEGSRYKDKLLFIQGIDPYSLKPSDMDASLEELPKLSKNIIMDYLMFRTSEETNTEIRACKSLDAFAQFVCKWIEAIAAKKIADNFIVLGKVKHSQRMSESPLKPWIILSPKGNILACHCNCVAGLGEVCTHVASILFAMEYAGTHEEKSVTDVLAYWIGPSKKGRFYKRLSEIDFTSPSAILKESTLDESDVSENQDAVIPPLNPAEMNDFIARMEELNLTAAFMLPQAKNKSNIPLELPTPFSTLYNENFYDKTLRELQAIGATIDIGMSKMQADLIFEQTVEQSSSDLWFQFRTGRVTASKFKSVCRTSLDKPSISLIKSICYPNKNKKMFKAGVYGCKHEQEALDKYMDDHKNLHPNAKLRKCGLVIDPKQPYFGASPDGMLICSECEEICIEIKCPYCVRDAPVEEILKFKSSYLKDEGNAMQLDQNHAYYYQVQMQMALTHKKFCDFVVWTSKSFFKQRISFDEVFWNSESTKAREFFIHILMPELLAGYFSRKVHTTSDPLKK